MVISVQQAAQILKVEVDRVYKLIYAHKLLATKVSKKWLISSVSLDSYKRARDAKR